MPITAKLPISLDPFDLQPGDLIKVRSVAEIRSALDADGRTSGPNSITCMWAFCWRWLHVLGHADRMISKRIGEFRVLWQIAIFEGASCDGKAHGGCQRGCFVFWKDTWLKRSAKQAQGAEESAGSKG